MTGIEVVVRGRVQGVGFRQFTADRARRRGLRGWVRNQDDGSVCIRVWGDEDELRAFTRDLQVGPPAARVDNFEAGLIPDDEPPPVSFLIRG